MSDSGIHWGRASSDPLLGRLFHVTSSGQDLELFSFCSCKASGTVSSCVKCSRSSVSCYLLVLRFLSLIFRTFLVPGIKEMLLRPSRAGSWHQHGDLKALWNVLLAAQHSLGPLGQDLKLSQTLNSLESFSTVEISLAGNEVVGIFIQLWPSCASTAGWVKWRFLLLQSSPASAVWSKADWKEALEHPSC